ncbi:MAG: NAD(P)/FAD-dependent oxidoreductase [Pseudomonadota bacterium]|jgi:geranylgeranyl reductase family protein|nr:NAD(P)/FAD-dependent oxidoreductase [Rubrivivax sp.]MCA3258981.1 NAD(P)/FAD-dependent oxidoreductase [Rubrivivax sp.]MCE2912932.1 NAD(P)/FAD-dependent oxidoreductase [Rubrivivax sp.]MCZ8032091.1 NAD(P)/FAD-dependent oxidoreductase [Rubrivivax sp.]
MVAEPPAPVLPARCDVLVVGAGPAGSACAQWLARAGLDTLLVDQHDFPRDKTCGDGLIPDAHAALQRLGVADEVAALAEPVRHVRCVATRGGFVDVPGTLSVLPRKLLDHVLVRAAVRAGARLATPVRFEAPLLEVGGSAQRVVGARLKHGGSVHEVAARWTVLATGAAAGPLQAAGVCRRHTPSGIALRGYVHNDAMRDRIGQLQIVWHPRLKGGYGWIFPAPGGVFNIGAGLTGSHVRTRRGKGRMQDVNLRRFFEAFCEVYEPARELMATGTLQGDLKGAPLRCSLIGADWSRPGMLVTGEAAGSTYAFSGEGIGKAMETGLLAAEAIIAQHPQADGDAQARAQYEAAMCAVKPKFDLYETASHVNHRPWLTDLVVWRARRSPRILARMSGVLEETQNPGRLLSWRGLAKLMLE